MLYVVVRVVWVVWVVWVAQHHHQIRTVGYCCLVLDASVEFKLVSFLRLGMEVITKREKGCSVRHFVLRCLSRNRSMVIIRIITGFTACLAYKHDLKIWGNHHRLRIVFLLSLRFAANQRIMWVAFTQNAKQTQIAKTIANHHELCCGLAGFVD